MSIEIVPKSSNVHSCQTCDYHASRLSQYERHLLTAKHIKATSATDSATSKVPENVCEKCNKKYADRKGLWRHKKSCVKERSLVQVENPLSLIPQDTILEIMKELVVSQNQNNDLQQKILEQQSKIIELTHAKTVNNTNTNCNNNNKIININMFLNEQCKDAITIQEFLKSIKPTVEDVMYLTEHGNKEGISKIITNALGQLEITERPVHCTDLKRHTTYVKHPEGWNKEQDQIHTKKIYDHTVHKCSTQLNEIFDKDPKYYERGTDEYENRIKMMTETFSDKNRDAILRNVEVSIQLDKNLIE
jgi:hypothetical protein